MRAILTAIIILSVSTVGAMPAPVSHRQPTAADVAGVVPAQTDQTAVEKDNELLDQPSTQNPIVGADQVQSEQNAFAKKIEQENGRIDRSIKGICRGC